MRNGSYRSVEKKSDKLGLVLHSRMFFEKPTIRVLHLIGFAGDSESDKPSWRLDSGVLVLRIGQIGLDSGVLVLRASRGVLVLRIGGVGPAGEGGVLDSLSSQLYNHRNLSSVAICMVFVGCSRIDFVFTICTRWVRMIFLWICWHCIDVGNVFALLLRLVLALRASAMRACFGVAMRE